MCTAGPMGRGTWSPKHFSAMRRDSGQSNIILCHKQRSDYCQVHRLLRARHRATPASSRPPPGGGTEEVPQRPRGGGGGEHGGCHDILSASGPAAPLRPDCPRHQCRGDRAFEEQQQVSSGKLQPEAPGCWGSGRPPGSPPSPDLTEFRRGGRQSRPGPEWPGPPLPGDSQLPCQLPAHCPSELCATHAAVPDAELYALVYGEINIFSLLFLLVEKVFKKVVFCTNST